MTEATTARGSNKAAAPNRLFVLLALALGIFSWATILAFHNITDGDLWAKLSLGASVWLRGDFIRHDVFAFTPVLPKYIDHEWGAGFIWYGLLNWFGAPSLMLLKIALACGALGFAMAVARRLGTGWNSVLLLAIPAAASVLPGYIPVIRSHAFTYCFFGATLFCLEEMRRGCRWSAVALICLMLVWTNVHGGFVAGLGTIAVYAFWAVISRQHARLMLISAVGCGLVTLVNPYGFEFWKYLLPAVLHPRGDIAEWRRLPAFAWDDFVGFRVLFVLVVGIVVAGWRGTEKRSWPGLVMLAVTAYLGWKSRRHVPFFGVAALAFVPAFLGSILVSLQKRFAATEGAKVKPLLLLGIYGVVAALVAAKFLPGASLHSLAPLGHDPVREVDILALAKAEGNLATPFGWGSYCAWRLFPRIKISMDGRYETTYPESTFQMNNDFFDKRGDHWDRLIREYSVDYVILDLRHERLRPEDLLDHGYMLVWKLENVSALLALNKHAPLLEKTVHDLPPTTIDPLDARIPKHWWQ